MFNFKKAYFDELCPNCGGRISAKRLELGWACEKCIEKEKGDLFKILLKNGNLKDKLKEIYYLNKEVEKYRVFFKSKIGFEPWKFQLNWAKRVLLRRSFAILAPTGVGKSTFGITISAFLSKEKKFKSYIVIPTKTLVEQTFKKISKISRNIKIVAYTGKSEEKEKIEKGKFDIFISTSQFLYRNSEILKNKFDFIFVDDVDSLLKGSKSIDTFFYVLGFEKDELELVFKREKEQEDWEKIEEIKNSKKLPIVVMSSATLKPRSQRVKLFNWLLGFEIQRANTTLRNIEEYAIKTQNLQNELVKKIKSLGKGGLVFVPMIEGKEGVEKVIKILNLNKINAISYEEFHDENVEKFRKGEIEVVVGIASSQNPLARGIDLPDAIRYAVFYGVPQMKFKALPHPTPQNLLPTLFSLFEFFEDKDKIEKYILYLKKYKTLTKPEKYPKIMEKLQEIFNFLKEKFQDQSFIDKINRSESTSIVFEENEPYIIIGDAVGYLQASGRTSRLFAGGLTKGLSVIIYQNQKALNSLKKRLIYFFGEMPEFKEWNEEEISKILKEIDEDREKVKLINLHKKIEQIKDITKMVLVVVESPTKAKTIARFLGEPSKRRIRELMVYEINIGNQTLLITASQGHVLDLTQKGEGFFGVLKEDEYFIPIYSPIRYLKRKEEMIQKAIPKSEIENEEEIIKDKLEIINSLRELALEVDEILIGTDPDAEGEKIAWDIYLALKPFNSNIKRIEFHEITKKAFLKALEEKREFDIDRVNAQIVRRIADRWIGFGLSQRLMKTFEENRKILYEKLKNPGLIKSLTGKNVSAGRVQTPVLKWIDEKEKEANSKKHIIVISKNNIKLEKEFQEKEWEEEKIKEIFEKIDRIIVEKISEYEETLNPSPPFTTSTLLQEGGKMLKMSANEIMKYAQELFEKGLITYHRTDSTRVSDMGKWIARQYIEENFGGEYFYGRGWGEGGAHECIRPTSPRDKETIRNLINYNLLDLSYQALRLYEIIFKRFISSQMKSAKVKKVKYLIKIPHDELKFKEEKEFITKVIEDGFNLIQPLKTYEKLEEGEFVLEENDKKLYLNLLKGGRYTEANLVAKMKERGLGRPSTYAKIISTLFKRDYVIYWKDFIKMLERKIGEKANKLLKAEPKEAIKITSKGEFICSIIYGNEDIKNNDKEELIQNLHKYFGKWKRFVEENYTKELEEKMDKIENREEDYQKVLRELHEDLEELLLLAKTHRIEFEDD